MCAFSFGKARKLGGRDKIRRPRPGLPGLSGPALASLLLPFLPLPGGDGDINRKDHRGGRVAGAGVVF